MGFNDLGTLDMSMVVDGSVKGTETLNLKSYGLHGIVTRQSRGRTNDCHDIEFEGINGSAHALR